MFLSGLTMTSTVVMGARRHGQRGAGGEIAIPENIVKCFMLQMLSKVSLEEVFMHYYEKMSSASQGFAPIPPPGLCLWTPLGTSML